MALKPGSQSQLRSSKYKMKRIPTTGLKISSYRIFYPYFYCRKMHVVYTQSSFCDLPIRAVTIWEDKELMVHLIFVTSEGQTINADGSEGTSAMKAAVDADVPGIDADCGGACSCATCHVRVPSEFSHLVGPPGSTERDMLEFEDSADDRSRLSCQIILTAEMEGLVLEVADRE